MKRSITCMMLTLFTIGIASSDAKATLAYDQNVTPDVIFGTGNGNGHFTIDRTGDLELGLRGKLRYAGIYNSDGAGRYTFPTGHVPGVPTMPLWNFEFSVNTNYTGSGTENLDDLSYRLDIDYDPAIGVQNFQSFDPISNPGVPFFYDHAIGTNSTPNGGGTEATSNGQYSGLLANNNVAQNSWNQAWFQDLTHIATPDVAGEYDIVLTAFSGGMQVGQTAIVVAAVPEASQVLCLTLVFGLIGTTWVVRRRWGNVAA